MTRSEKVQQLSGQVPWGHHLALVSKLDDPAAREFYVRRTLERGPGPAAGNAVPEPARVLLCWAREANATAEVVP